MLCFTYGFNIEISPPRAVRPRRAEHKQYTSRPVAQSKNMRGSGQRACISRKNSCVSKILRKPKMAIWQLNT
jgi:hypothetical protein